MNLGEVPVLLAGNNGLRILEYVHPCLLLGRSGSRQPLRQLKVTQKKVFSHVNTIGTPELVQFGC